MAASADLVVNIVTKLSGDGMREADKQTSKFKSGLNKASVGAGVALGAIVAFGKGAVDAASKTQQAIGAVESVFGKQAGRVEEFSKDSAKNMGLAGSAYLQYAALVGGALQNAGFSAEQSVGKSNKLMQRAADLAATYGGTTADAVDAVTAAISRGEFDPLEKFNVSLNATSVNAQLAAKGQDKLTGSALAHAKAQIIMEQIYAKSAKTAGQYAREQDSAAGSAQTAAAQFEDMQSALGTALLPAITMVSTALGKLATLLAKHKTTTQVVIVIIAAMAAAIIALNIAVTVYTAVTTLAASATLAAWAATLGPILLVIAAVGLVVLAVVILWKKCAAFRNAVKAIWAAVAGGARMVWAGIKRIGAVAENVFGWIKSHWRLMASILGGPMIAAALVIIANWGRIRDRIASIIGWLKDAWRTAVRVIRDITGGIRDTAVAVFGAVRERWADTMGALKSAAAGLGKILAAPFELVKAAIDRVISAVQSLIGWLGKIHVPKISLPHIPGINAGSVATVAPVGAATRAATPALGAPVARSSRAVGSGVVININGAIDPEGTARQVQRILGGHERRVGRAVL